MSGLSTYASETRGVADEIVHLIRTYPGLLEHCQRLVQQVGIPNFLEMDEGELTKARALLKKTPRQREAIDKKLASPKEEVRNAAVLTLIRARLLGLMGANAIALADDLSYLPGAGYRAAVDRAAARAHATPVVPTIDSLLRTRF